MKNPTGEIQFDASRIKECYRCSLCDNVCRRFGDDSRNRVIIVVGVKLSQIPCEVRGSVLTAKSRLGLVPFLSK